MSKKYALIGATLRHSLSPQIYDLLGLDYELIELKEQEIEHFVGNNDLGGFNVTIPYKQKIMPFIDVIDEDAKDINAINTVVYRDGKTYAYNTDVYGMRSAIAKVGIDLLDKVIMILGSGGTSNTAQYICKKAKSSKVIVVGRNRDVNYDNCYDCSDVQFIINTTPIGMFPNGGHSPIDLSRFPKLLGVYDAVYNPLETVLVSQAKQLGLPVTGGLYMLVAQAIKVHEIYTNTISSVSKLDEIYRLILKTQTNIVLIGMGGCGKSVIAKALAKILNREYIDTDRVIQQRELKTAQEIIVTQGEKYFREVESEVISEVSGRLGVIIATGGGVPLKENNNLRLKQNGVIVYIVRAIEDLSTKDRPIYANANSIREVFDNRDPIYMANAVIVVNNNRDIASVVKEILERYDENFSN